MSLNLFSLTLGRSHPVKLPLRNEVTVAHVVPHRDHVETQGT